MKKQNTMSCLLENNNHIETEEQQEVYACCVDWFREQVSDLTNEENSELEDLIYYLAHPWVVVQLEQTHPALQEVFIDKRQVKAPSFNDQTINEIKKSLLEYKLQLKKDTPIGERWEVYTNLITKAFQNKAVLKEVNQLCFDSTLEAKRLRASEAFYIGSSRVAIIEELDSPNENKRYHLYVYHNKYGCPHSLTRNIDLFLKEEAGVHLIEIESNDTIQAFIKRLVDKYKR